MGEGSGSLVSVEKGLKLSPGTGELDGGLPRTDGCVDSFCKSCFVDGYPDK